METSDVLGREMLIQGQNLRESVLPNEAERSLKLEDGIPEIPKSRRDCDRDMMSVKTGREV